MFTALKKHMEKLKIMNSHLFLLILAPQVRLDSQYNNQNPGNFFRVFFIHIPQKTEIVKYSILIGKSFIFNHGNQF